MIENFLALIVSNLLSMAGLVTITDKSFIFVPTLQHTFLITLSCSSWVVIMLQAFLYTFIMWVYFASNGHSIKRRTYLIIGLIGFTAFFFTNILRISAEIYLLGKVYNSTYWYYIINWQAYEEQIGMALMFATLSVLSLLSYFFFKRGMKRYPVYDPKIL